ncbi:hypothetical protein HAX54_039636 [Datura stramonium]|uniref:RING-type domain-containing protein n=1 Tax=Datura stramonium TaxID=4076 RepID=A0ABS8VM92_DATST|nr:hypothetical protein [Datura stramonium]
MVSDSTPSASIPVASSNPKDFARKKRANRSAKLKQWKLDARREQWLSQVKNKGLKEEVNVRRNQGPATNIGNERDQFIQKLEIKPRGEEDHEVNNDSINHYSDLDLNSNSPISHSSSIMERNDSGANFAGSSSSSISSCSGSGGCCSGSLSEEDDHGDDDDCMDDWEAVADALAATDQKLEQHHPGSDSSRERDENLHLSSRADVSSGITENDTTKKSEHRGLASSHPVSFNAWRPDDAFRPQILPNLSKQFNFPMNSERHCHGGAVWGCKRLSVPTSCPICCEDLDFTDTSFLPCTCGFVLCLFCHKRILEEDGRCPGCRKQYNHEPVEGEATLDGGSLKFQLARSCSMISRS